MHQLKAAWVIVMKGVWAQYIYRDDFVNMFRDGMIGCICKDEGMHSSSSFSIFLLSHGSNATRNHKYRTRGMDRHDMLVVVD